MTDISIILLAGTFTGEVKTGANEKATKYLTNAAVTVAHRGAAVTIPVRGFGAAIEGAEGLIDQEVLVLAKYQLEDGKNENAGKTYGNTQVVRIMDGPGESRNTFMQTGTFIGVETKGKLKIVTLEVSDSYWNKDTRTNVLTSKQINIAFYEEFQKGLDDLGEGQRVLIEGKVKSSGEKNFLDFLGESALPLGNSAVIDTDDL